MKREVVRSKGKLKGKEIWIGGSNIQEKKDKMESKKNSRRREKGR